ncbi:MAG: carbamoyl-phosphate synthase large subunit [Planctomycetes bacterium]|nr:carbamoyl-phosphate synthase large subunit [Planctomycetota bacterium]
MPKRTDLKKILIIGAGPIVIGQACEFDYSGSQACKALREEGYHVVLVNSNPATIMTDPGMADATYIEPITPEVVEQVIARERPDALIPTLGGQTALNVASILAERGVPEKYGVEIIGASPAAIRKAESREEFRAAMAKIGLACARSGIARSVEEAQAIAQRIGFPVIIRPGYTLGGAGGGVAYHPEELAEIAARGLAMSIIGEVLIEESLIGWKEFELEVMRDHRDTVVIICSIENFDPMGVHTGDSITVAPAQTLTDREYQAMRDAAIAIIREIGVATGGSNIQFAIKPDDGRMVVIEMNPRVSRSSALASKATGFPIAKIATKLAVGYTLDELPNDITRETPASFEPTIDYCVVKVPRFAFEKFPTADPTLTTSMKSVGETMAIGRTFKEALMKAIRGIEARFAAVRADDREAVLRNLRTPTGDRLAYLFAALRDGWSVAEVAAVSQIDPWFIENIRQVIEVEAELAEDACRVPRAACQESQAAPSGHAGRGTWDGLPLLRRAKETGLSDHRIGELVGMKELEVRRLRLEAGIRPTMKLIDTCAAEFAAATPYFYSTYEEEDESRPNARPKVVIIGSGPNRIGQGIEFDYCCVHAVFAAQELGYEAIMVNSNPETVSTDYDTADKLYFEPVTLENVLNVVEAEKPVGVVVQLGGQTPLSLAVPLERAGVPILGTTPDQIDRAEDRERFAAALDRLGFRQAPNRSVRSLDEARRAADELGYPVLVRPSYVLGGRAMEIVLSRDELDRFVARAIDVAPEHPVLVDKFLENAIEMDVDAVCDGTEVYIGGLMEHIEEAGVHSGDSSCVLPPHTLPWHILDEVRRETIALALEFQVRGLINIQFAVQDGRVFILEVNPRASRTVPFVSKASNVPLAKVATKVMLGKTLAELGVRGDPPHFGVSVKAPVYPFNRFPGVDAVLGPEMKSTGEVMGIAETFGVAFAKAQSAAGTELPRAGTVFLSVRNSDKAAIAPIARRFHQMGFQLLATGGTCAALREAGVPAQHILKVSEGRPNVVDWMKNRAVHLIINTPSGKTPRLDEVSIRTTAVLRGVPLITTVPGAAAAASAIEALRAGRFGVKPLQAWHGTRA